MISSHDNGTTMLWSTFWMRAFCLFASQLVMNIALSHWFRMRKMPTLTAIFPRGIRAADSETHHNQYNLFTVTQRSQCVVHRCRQNVARSIFLKVEINNSDNNDWRRLIAFLQVAAPFGMCHEDMTIQFTLRNWEKNATEQIRIGW